MTSRKIRALEALAARGATEGEREAARNALRALRGKQPAATPSPPRQPPPPSRKRDPSAYAEFLNTLFANQRVGSWRVQWPSEPAPPQPRPPKTTVRAASSADFPDAETAEDGDDPGSAQIEVYTAAQMHARFADNRPFEFVWRGQVFKGVVSGIKHDRERQRFYVVVRYPKLVQVVQVSP